MDRRTQILDITAILLKEYPVRHTPLNYKNHYQLLIAVILSAQTTDNQVNKVTPELFRRFPSAADLAGANLEDIEAIIRTTGFYHVKARNIKGAAVTLGEKFNGQVPDRMEALLSLPGVGRKTANVILGHCFNQPAIVVDTHFKRVCHRLGLTRSRNPDKIEMELKKLIPEELQMDFSMIILFHGRKYCHAGKPECGICPVEQLCGYADKRIMQ